MSGESAFVVEGAVVEALANGLLLVQLTNGHCLLGHVARRQVRLMQRVSSGDKVTVKLSPGDLSHGYVVLNESKI